MEKKLTKKAIEKMVEAAYYAGCRGIAINIMKIGTVFKVGTEAFARGERGPELATTIRAYVETIREN